MAWADGLHNNSNNSKTADQASHDLVINNAQSDIPAGEVVILNIAVDNNATVDGDEGAVTSVTDNKGNTWTKIREFTNGQGSAQAGACISMWYSQLTTTLVASPTPDTITANFSNSSSRDAVAICYHSFTPRAGSTISVEASTEVAGDGADPPSMTLSSLSNREHLFVTGLATEGPSTDSFTYDADYNGLEEQGTTGGAADSNMSCRGGWRIATLTTDTFDMSADARDNAQVFAALNEDVPAVPISLVGPLPLYFVW